MKTCVLPYAAWDTQPVYQLCTAQGLGWVCYTSSEVHTAQLLCLKLMIAGVAGRRSAVFLFMIFIDVNKPK